MVGDLTKWLKKSITTGGAQFLLTHRPPLQSQLLTDPIPDPLTPTTRTDGTIIRVLAKDPGKANEITAPINMENVAEIRVIIDAIVTTVTIMTIKIVTSAKKRGPLMASPLLKVGRDQPLFAHTCDLSPFQP
jgi:hypothetical protein